MTESREDETRLMNVDLEVESAHDLQPLIDGLSPGGYSLERPPGRACFELSSAVSPRDPEPLVIELVGLVKALPIEGRAAWDAASRRTFDIGYQAGTQPFQVTHELSSETLRAVAEIGAAVAITIYAPPSDEEAGPFPVIAE